MLFPLQELNCLQKGRPFSLAEHLFLDSRVVGKGRAECVELGWREFCHVHVGVVFCELLPVRETCPFCEQPANLGKLVQGEHLSQKRLQENLFQAVMVK